MKVYELTYEGKLLFFLHIEDVWEFTETLLFSHTALDKIGYNVRVLEVNT